MLRTLVVTASARRRPACTSGIAVAGTTNPNRRTIIEEKRATNQVIVTRQCLKNVVAQQNDTGTCATTGGGTWYLDTSSTAGSPAPGINQQVFTGVFTPNVDGPNPARKWQANNVGDVFVTAEVELEVAVRPKPPKPAEKAPDQANQNPGNPKGSQGSAPPPAPGGEDRKSVA